MDVIMEMVCYKTDKLYKVLYISSLPQIAKFVNPDDTETVHVQIISITECVSWSLSDKKFHHNCAINSLYTKIIKTFFKMKEYVGI